MNSKFIVAAPLVLFVFELGSVAASADDVQVYAGQPGPYEVHQYWHRPDSFTQRPYFATNPPVYYGSQPLVRSYGWTPYPYLGTQYREPLWTTPRATNVVAPKAKPESAKPESAKRRFGTERQRGA